MYDSNIFGAGSTGTGGVDNTSSESDIEINFTPTIQYTKQSGLISLGASVGGAFSRFLDNSDLDHDGIQSSFDLTFPSDDSYRYAFTLSGGFNQGTAKDRFLGGRIDSDTFSLTAQMDYRVNERWGFGVSGSWSDTSYNSGVSQGLSGSLTSQTQWSTGINFDYIYSEKLSLQLDYRYSQTASAFDSKDQSWSLRAIGQLSPAITGTLGAGFQMRNGDRGDSSDPLLIAGLTWTPPFERISFNLDINSGFRTTANGSSSTNYGASVGIGYVVSGKVTAALNVGYDYASYDNFDIARTDKDFSIGAGLSWAIRESTSLDLTTRWNDNRSDADGFNYDSWSIGLALTSSF